MKTAGRRAPAADAPDVQNAESVPVGSKCKDEYRKYIAAPDPKAFAITTKGGCAWQQSQKPNRPHITASPDPAVRAMEY